MEDIEEYKKNMQGRNTGKCGIGDPRRKNISSRAMKGELEVVKLVKPCPNCGHHKAIRSITKYKCSRCKKVLV